MFVFFFLWCCCCSVYCRIVVILYCGWCFFFFFFSFVYSSNSIKPGMTHTRNSNRKRKTSESQRDTQAHVPFFFFPPLSHPPKGERKGAPCTRTVVIFAYVKVCHHHAGGGGAGAPPPPHRHQPNPHTPHPHPPTPPRHTDIHSHTAQTNRSRCPLTSSAAQDTCSSCCFYYQCT